MPETTDTSLAAFDAITDAGEDVTLRRQIAAALRDRPMTTHELGEQFPERTANTIRPRINELLRMGCVERDGTRENPSGHAAYVHHLTPEGEAYARGECDPDPAPTLAEAKRHVVRAARDFCDGGIDEHVLAAVVRRHDDLAERLDPEGEA